MDEPASPDDAAWLARAVALAVDNVHAGGGPFGAIVVRDGVLVATGVNQVVPTAAALWSRLDRVVYAADQADAVVAGFDDRVPY